MTMHSLYLAYHNGFDSFSRWVDHHHAMHAKHPLGCAEFGAEWLRRWGEVGRLLNQRCIIQELGQRNAWFDAEDWPNAGRAILAFHDLWTSYRDTISPPAYRITLLDGTIIREWPAKDEYDDIF
jgi:hypothetical protein